MRVVLLGAPGAGKGTQCKRVLDKYGIVHLSSGDILRQNRADGTELGKKAQGYMDSGGLVPDELIVEMMSDAIKKEGTSGFVLDGFPRTVNQARELDEALASDGQKIDIVLNLMIDDETIMDRMAGRRSCPKCGSVYHLKNLKPKVEGICDNDGAELIQRPDDNPDVVANRLKTYHEQTAPVVGYYKENNTVLDIDASKDADEASVLVFEQLDTFVQA
ncbi:MAG: adenylate kinase [Planctomycetota bacterium]|jgi:adenylate kinase